STGSPSPTPPVPRCVCTIRSSPRPNRTMRRTSEPRSIRSRSACSPTARSTPPPPRPRSATGSSSSAPATSAWTRAPPRRGAPSSTARWGCGTPGGRSRSPAAGLVRAGLDGLGSGQALGRPEDGEVAVGGSEEHEVELTVADGRQLATEQGGRGAVTLGGPVRVDDTYPGAGGQGRPQAVEELVGILDLVIHVREERHVHGARG